MRIASWGRSAGDFLYLVAATVVSDVEFKASYDKEKEVSTVQLDAIGTKDGIMVSFSGSMNFDGVPKEADIFSKFSAKRVKTLDSDGDEYSIPAPPEFWASTLNPKRLKEIVDAVKLAISGGKKKFISFDYDVKPGLPGTAVITFSVEGEKNGVVFNDVGEFTVDKLPLPSGVPAIFPAFNGTTSTGTLVKYGNFAFWNEIFSGGNSVLANKLIRDISVALRQAGKTEEQKKEEARRNVQNQLERERATDKPVRRRIEDLVIPDFDKLRSDH